MILEIAQLEALPGKSAEFEAQMEKIARNMVDCLGYRGQELHRDVERENHYYIIARWDRLENHTWTFANSAVLQEAQAALKPLIVGPPTVHHTELVFND
jgi:quinol monooxygenase YgiN